MKLKKIASLALAGVMAVSVLAGCAGKTNTNTNTNTGTSTNGDLAAVMDEFNGTGVDIEYTNDSKLSTALEQVLKVYGATAYDGGNSNNQYVSTDFETAVMDLGGFEDVKPATKSTAGLTWGGHVIGGGASYKGTYEEKEGDLNGKTYTVYDIFAVVGAGTQEAAMNLYATKMSQNVASVKLPAESYTATKPQVDEKYYEYSYTCPVGMASVKLPDGQTAYFFMYEMNQTVTTKTVG